VEECCGRIKIFHNDIKFWVEEDVQWIYITHLELVGDSLFVKDEKPRCFSLDLANPARKAASMRQRSTVNTHIPRLPSTLPPA
jgi:hypothetical protein